MTDSDDAVEDVLEVDAATGTYHASFDWAEVAPSTAVVEVTAAAADVDVNDVAPLYSAVDPDALDRLFQPRSNGKSRRGGSVTFVLQGFEVTVESSGEITLKETG